MGDESCLKEVGDRLVYDGYRKIVARTFILPSGKEKIFELKKEGRSGAVVAITEDGNVVLVRQYRPGFKAESIDLPGGGIGDDEDPESGVRRELSEETGYDGDFHLVRFFSPDAYSTGIKYAFAATNCRKIRTPNPDEDEFVETVLMSLDKFRDHLRKGQITDLHIAYLGLDYLKLL